MARIENFTANAQGSVAAVYAIAALPVLMAVGVSVDYSRGSAARADLRSALDSTALGVAHDARTLPANEAKARAKVYFAAALDRRYPGAAHHVDIAIDGDIVTVTGSVEVPTTIMRLGGVNQLPVREVSKAMMSGAGDIEVMLALDNTGSMGREGKLEALKSAAHRFVTVLEAEASKKRSVKIGLAPFAAVVNVGKSRKDEKWLRWDVAETNADEWSGCVTDRDQPYDATDAPPAEFEKSMKHPAADCGGGVAEYLPLTDKFRDVRARIDEMKAEGLTNITIGVATALSGLGSTHPLGKAKPHKTPNLKKYLIILTDGDNTRNRWTRNAKDIDARTRAACAAAKDMDVNVFTIRMVEGNADLLRECASSPSNYYDSRSPAQLDSVFESIAREISRLRLTA